MNNSKSRSEIKDRRRNEEEDESGSQKRSMKAQWVGSSRVRGGYIAWRRQYGQRAKTKVDSQADLGGS